MSYHFFKVFTSAKKIRENQRQMLVPSQALSMAEGPSVKTCPKSCRGYFTPEEEDASGHPTWSQKYFLQLGSCPEAEGKMMTTIQPSNTIQHQEMHRKE